jgi:hypothetical protein
LKQGDAVDIVIMNSGLMIVDQSTDFNSDEIKAELDLAQKLLDEKEKREQFAWIKKLSPEERAEIKESWEATEKAMKELEEGKGEIYHLDVPHWDLQQQKSTHVLDKKELLLQHLTEQRELLKASKEIKEVIESEDADLAQESEETKKSLQLITKKVIEERKGTRKGEPQPKPE